MSGYGPSGYSWSLSFHQSLLQMQAPPIDRRGGKRSIAILAWAVMRLALGVTYGMIFECVGFVILAQTAYNGYDFRATHRRPHAQVFIGATGGLAIGLLLMLFDVIFARVRPLADYEPLPRPGRALPPPESTLPNIVAVRNQAAARLLLWPILATASGLVGSALWHLSVNTRPQPNSGYRGGTAAVVGVVGSAVTVSGPSLLQLVLIVAAGNRSAA